MFCHNLGWSVRQSRSDSRIKRYVLSSSIAFSAMLVCLLSINTQTKQEVLSGQEFFVLNLNLNLIFNFNFSMSTMLGPDGFR